MRNCHILPKKSNKIKRKRTKNMWKSAKIYKNRHREPLILTRDGGFLFSIRALPCRFCEPCRKALSAKRQIYFFAVLRFRIDAFPLPFSDSPTSGRRRGCELWFSWFPRAWPPYGSLPPLGRSSLIFFGLTALDKSVSLGLYRKPPHQPKMRLSLPTKGRILVPAPIIL